MLKVLNVCLLIFIICSCAHNTEARFKSSLTEGQCEVALQNLPNFKTKKVSEYGLTASSATAGYALTSTAHRYDLIYFVVGGIAIPTLACMPAGPHTFSFSGIAALYEKCFEKLHPTFESELRCPDLSLEVDRLLAVAQCYEKRGDIKKAREQRELLLEENAYGGCISEEHRNKISHIVVHGN